MRNFYLEATIDGKKEKLSGGPRTRAGEMEVKFFQKNSNMEKGKMILFSLECRVTESGSLRTVMFNSKGDVHDIWETEVPEDLNSEA